MPAIHPWDLAAMDLTHWLQTEPEYYVEALKGGYRTPFAADVSEADKLAYYRRQIFMQNPDGTPDYSKPNEQGRDMLMRRVGIEGYTQIMAAAMPRQPGLQLAEAGTGDEKYNEENLQEAHQAAQTLEAQANMQQQMTPPPAVPLAQDPLSPPAPQPPGG